MGRGPACVGKPQGSATGGILLERNSTWMPRLGAKVGDSADRAIECPALSPWPCLVSMALPCLHGTRLVAAIDGPAYSTRYLNMGRGRWLAMPRLFTGALVESGVRFCAVIPFWVLFLVWIPGFKVETVLAAIRGGAKLVIATLDGSSDSNGVLRLRGCNLAATFAGRLLGLTRPTAS